MSSSFLERSAPVAPASTAGVLAVAAGALAFSAVFLIAAVVHRPAARLGTPRSKVPQRMRWPASGRRRTGILALAALTVLSTGPIGAVILVVAALAVPPLRRRRSAERERLDVVRSMPDAVEVFVLCVHAGRSPAQAIAELASTAPLAVRRAFQAVELQRHRGRTLADALGELARHAGAPGRELAAAIAMADRDGLPLAPVLDRLATEARAQRRRSGDAAARRLPVQLSFPLVACTLPSFALLAIAPAVLGALSTLRGRAP